MTAATTRVHDAISRAAEWRLLGLLFERPRAGWEAEIQAHVAMVAVNLRETAAAVARTTESEYLALLGPGGAASPREAGYVGMRDPAWVLADILRYYDAFAFHPRAEDPPDHVAVEVGFVAYLHLKEAFAFGVGDVEAAATTRAARERFVVEHLATMARPMAERLGPARGVPLIRAAHELAERVPSPPRASRPSPGGEEALACATCGSFVESEPH